MNGPVVTVIVADGVGAGAGADAGAFGTGGANTLGNTAAAVGGLSLPVLGALGLGRVTEIAGVPWCESPTGFTGTARMRSAACDTPSGHWELMGTVSQQAPVCFPAGFPDELIDELTRAWGVDGVLANRPMSGLDALAEYGEEHLAGGRPIVYTSADSVLQVACHTDRYNVERLWDMCATAREVCVGDWAVGRVIARPFDGPGPFRRASEWRRDLSVPVPAGAWCRVHDAGWSVWAVGKAGDILGHVGIDHEVHASGLGGQLGAASRSMQAAREAGGGLVIANVAEFDYRGHARDVEGMAGALCELDTWLGSELGRLREGDVVLITADHGNDPTHTVDDSGRAHVDHTREDVPVVVAVGGVSRGGDVSGTGGRRRWCDMADVGAGVCRWLGVDASGLDGVGLTLVSGGGGDD